MSDYQSAYRKFYFSETALLRIQNDILVSLDSGHSTALLLDLSAEFDTIDHNILFLCLKLLLDISSFCSFIAIIVSHQLFSNYISFLVESQVLLELGIPQGNILGHFTLLSVYQPTLFYHLHIPWHSLSFLCG